MANSLSNTEPRFDITVMVIGKEEITRMLGKCKRCWYCCVVDYEPVPEFLEAHVVPWVEISREDNENIFGSLKLFMCSVLGVNRHYQPHCLIYKNRPQLCKDYPNVDPKICEVKGCPMLKPQKILS